MVAGLEYTFNLHMYDRHDELQKKGLDDSARVGSIFMDTRLSRCLNESPIYATEVADNIKALEHRGYLRLEGHEGRLDLQIGMNRDGNVRCDIKDPQTHRRVANFSFSDMSIEDHVQTYLGIVKQIKNGGMTLEANEQSREDAHLTMADQLVEHLQNKEPKIILDHITAKKIVAVQAFAIACDCDRSVILAYHPGQNLN